MRKIALIIWSLIPRKLEKVEYYGDKRRTEIVFVWLGIRINAQIK